jgi:multidrug efflux pump subunit AcrB
MKLVEFSVKRYHFTIVAFFALVAIGISTFFSIPRSEDPPVSFAGSFIVAVYPGASPSDMEQLVADKLEDAIKELDNIKRLKTESGDGVMLLQVEFTYGQDPDKMYDDVLRQVNSIRSELPADLLSLDVKKIATTNVNILQAALVSEDAPYRELEESADKLKRRLETVSGVKDVETWAFPNREVKVSLNVEKLAQVRIPLGQVIAALQSGNANIPGGSVDIGNKKFNIKTSGNYKSVEEVQNTVVSGAQGKIVLLNDVADVKADYEEQNYVGRYNGKRAVFVTANLKEKQNIFKVRDGLWNELNEFEKTLPASMVLERPFDQSRNVEKRLSGLSRDFIIAILLVLLTLLPLGFRASVIVMVSIPLSLLIGLFLLDSAGFNLNQLSIVGFVIALGLLVDDSIVVVENITRFLRMGYKPVDAAIAATKQIGVAVIGCTATLIFAFLPLLQLPGGPGDYIRSLPVAVVLTVLASLLVSFTIIPFLASRYLKEENDEHGNFFLQFLNKGIEKSYSRLLDWSLHRPRATLIGALGLFVASLGLIPAIGFSLFPKAGIPQFRVTVETPDGSSLAETNKAVQFVEQTLSAQSNVAWHIANVGKGNPQVYYNVSPETEKNNVGEIFAQLSRYDEKTSPKFFDSLRAVFATYPNAKIELKEFENGPQIDAPIAIRVVGDNLDTLRSLAARVETIFSETNGTQYINNPIRLSKTDIHVDIDREKAGMLGVAVIDVDRAVRMGVAGLPVGKFREAGGDDYNITVTLPRHDDAGGKQTLDALDKIYVASVTGAQIPLRQLASISFQASPTKINHYNKERSVTLTSFVKTGFNTNTLTNDIISQLDKMAFPKGYQYIVAGEVESRNDSFGGFGVAILVAVFGILATLVLEFGSFRSTLIVFGVVPLGVVGGMVMLFLTGNSLSFTAVIGFIALIGIEVKTSILLVDFTNQLREEGVGIMDAVKRAGEIRFVPVLLTSLTAIGGLIPIALAGSGLYSPLAWVMIGGLISSTLLARLVTPVMYLLLPPKISTAPDSTASSKPAMA